MIASNIGIYSYYELQVEAQTTELQERIIKETYIVEYKSGSERSLAVENIKENRCHIIDDDLARLTVTCNPDLATQIILEDHEARISALESLQVRP